MSKVVAIEHLTFDGVYQGPGRPDEDTRDGFTLGGWAAAAQDPKLQEVTGKAMGRSWSLLVGRVTYEDFYGYWPKQYGNPMADALNKVEKFVCSTSSLDLAWENAFLLKGKAADTVEKLKKEHKKNLVIFGSGMLVQSLMQRALVDEYLLMIHPIILGKGRRLFTDKCPLTKFKLLDSMTTATGVIIATYQPVPGR